MRVKGQFECKRVIKWSAISQLKKPRSYAAFYAHEPFLWRYARALTISLSIQHLRHIIDHRFAHRCQVMRGPGVAVGVLGVGGVDGELLDQEEQIGGLG